MNFLFHRLFADYGRFSMTLGLCWALADHFNFPPSDRAPNRPGFWACTGVEVATSTVAFEE